MTNESENTPTAPTGEPWLPRFDSETGEPLPSDVPMPVPFEVVRAKAAARTIEAGRRLHGDTTLRGGFYVVSDGAGSHVAVDANGVPLARPIEELEAELESVRAALPPK